MLYWYFVGVWYPRLAGDSALLVKASFGTQTQGVRRAPSYAEFH